MSVKEVPGWYYMIKVENAPSRIDDISISRACLTLEDGKHSVVVVVVVIVVLFSYALQQTIMKTFVALMLEYMNNFRLNQRYSMSVSLYFLRFDIWLLKRKQIDIKPFVRVWFYRNWFMNFNKRCMRFMSFWWHEHIIAVSLIHPG